MEDNLQIIKSERMPFIAKFLIFEIWIILIGMGTIVAFQMMTGKISLSNLLCNENLTQKLSPARLQLLVVLVAAALYYLFKLYKDPTRFPIINKGAVLAYGVSNLIYIADKYRMLSKGM